MYVDQNVAHLGNIGQHGQRDYIKLCADVFVEKLYTLKLLVIAWILHKKIVSVIDTIRLNCVLF